MWQNQKFNYAFYYKIIFLCSIEDRMITKRIKEHLNGGWINFKEGKKLIGNHERVCVLFYMMRH